MYAQNPMGQPIDQTRERERTTEGRKVRDTRKSVMDTAYTFSYTTGLDYVTLETKSIVDQ
jgi:hypothetical protein